ncbi:MAG: CHAT domain-containing protein [bacterium]|nr:CHAT domain-containing protein [bacterium]
MSATALNVGMFGHLNTGKAPVQALRSIELQMLRGEKGDDYTHPYHWSPFVVFGDGR